MKPLMITNGFMNNMTGFSIQTKLQNTNPRGMVHTNTKSSLPFHALIPIEWMADEDSLTCCIVMMGRQIAKMFYTFSL